MGSKSVVFFGLLLVLVLLISSEVSAKDLAEKQGHDAVNDYQGGGGRGGGGRGGGYPGGGGRGGGGRYDPPRGRGCYHGCCRRSNYGPPQCVRCCSYAGETIDTQTETNPHN